jgi:hypothetical protein
MLKRIIMHWTGGTDRLSEMDKIHYHWIVDGRGIIHKGRFDPEDNLVTGSGAQHTLGKNTGSIGIDACGMLNALEHDPWNTTDYPLNENQMNKFITIVADMCDKYKIPVTKTTVLNHGEVQDMLQVRQRGKWDINVLPFVVGDAGDWLRSKVKEELKIRRSGMDRSEALEIARKAAEAAVAGATDSDLRSASEVTVERGSGTSEFKLNGWVIGLITGVAALFGWDMEPDMQKQIIEHLSVVFGSMTAAYGTYRTWRKK